MLIINIYNKISEEIKYFKTKKTSVIIFTIIVVLLIAFSISYSIWLRYDSTSYYKKIDSLNLNTAQKLEDFEYLYDTITNGVISLDNYSEMYKSDFVMRKEYYKEQILNTGNDYEFYCTIQAILNDLPSYHTNVMFPLYESYATENCFNCENVITAKNIKGYTEYWYNLLKQNSVNCSLTNILGFEYIDGKYVKSFVGNAILDILNVDAYSYVELCEINGMPVDKYITAEIFANKLKYDHMNNKSYRKYIIFNNDGIGKKSEILLKFDNDVYKKYTLYTAVYSDTMVLYRNYFNNNLISSSDLDLYYLDKSNNTAYIKIDKFYGINGMEITKKIQESFSVDNIIIDLRENSGGTRQYFSDFLYAPLFEKDISVSNTRYIHNSDVNKRLFNGSLEDKYGNIYNSENNDTVYSATETYDLTGMADKKINVYVLTSSDTGSAADTFVNIVKSKELGVVVGANTAGEGLTYTYVMDILPNSKIVFSYNPAQAYNDDGTDNSANGTAPNIYSCLTYESFIDIKKMSDNGEDPYTYENRLKWDNVLIKTYGLIKEDEDDKGNNTANE